MSATRRIQSIDGTGLLLRTWEPDGSPQAVIVLVHGLGEHTGRYEHVGDDLAARGWRVLGVDLRGFGESDGPRAFVRDMDEFLDDVDVVRQLAAEADAPIVMLGHSLGGLIALRYAQERGKVDLLVLSAPAIDAAIPLPKKLAARVLRRVAPRMSLPNDITAEQLSRDPEVGEAYFADPLVHTASTTALGGSMLEAMAQARRGGTPVPTLVIHGEEDTLVPTEYSAPLADLELVERITFPDFRHESFNEGGGVTALETVSGWISARLSQTAP